MASARFVRYSESVFNKNVIIAATVVSFFDIQRQPTLQNKVHIYECWARYFLIVHLVISRLFEWTADIVRSSYSRCTQSIDSFHHARLSAYHDWARWSSLAIPGAGDFKKCAWGFVFSIADVKSGALPIGVLSHDGNTQKSSDFINELPQCSSWTKGSVLALRIPVCFVSVSAAQVKPPTD